MVQHPAAPIIAQPSIARNRPERGGRQWMLSVVPIKTKKCKTTSCRPRCCQPTSLLWRTSHRPLRNWCQSSRCYGFRRSRPAYLRSRPSCICQLPFGQSLGQQSKSKPLERQSNKSSWTPPKKNCALSTYPTATGGRWQEDVHGSFCVIFK
jgi:hypothetical protein